MKNLLYLLMAICIMVGTFLFFLFDVQVPFSVSMCIVAGLLIYVAKEAYNVYHI